MRCIVYETAIFAAVLSIAFATGYSMLIATSSLAITRLLYRSLPYAISDIAPVTLVCDA
jgi:hypothetical protein